MKSGKKDKRGGVMNNDKITIGLRKEFRERLENFRTKYYADIPFEVFLIFLIAEGFTEEKFWRDTRKTYCSDYRSYLKGQ